ncbi:MAG: hypothetical protein QOE90_129 [Thermoplasmata archaeon]|jgi:signal transduction histidine kinase|nr:hypothetical protein [Thermoplasmata archaeon]
MILDVLVVDDDDVDRLAVKRALRASGLAASVREARRCDEGLAALRSKPADVVLLDYMLPDGNGRDLLVEARAADIASPIVILTGQGDEALAVELMKAGATDYLPKALASPERLAQCVRNAVRLEAAESSARRQLAFTRAITDSLAEGVLALDEEGVVTFANAAADAMLSPQGGCVGLRLDALLRGPDLARIQEAVRVGRPARLERATMAGARGETLSLALTLAPSPATGGVVLALHDERERLRAQAELEESRKQLALAEKLSALGTLVSGVAHELRTPLTYLSNNIFLLNRRLAQAAQEDPRLAPLVEDIARHGEAALEGVERINSLVKDLRPFARGETGLRPQPGLEEIVGGAVELFRATTRGRVEVVSQLDPTGPLLADRGALQRVVINLLVNAAEAMPEGGTIRVETRAVGEQAEVAVADEGTGIAPEVRERIFDPFFTTKPDGTGLGLAITRRIVEVHGGAVRFETEVGAGTTFVLRLPLASTTRDVPVQDADALAAGPPPAVGDTG